ncbi:hypothetical protein ACQPZA_13150 [Pseudonocardia xinjiangensis]|uniref:hypothetical protein n=1 Tax=Pseudonocardia xinjiangensis TaxID=75289 RepID=UPI003D92EF22
MIVVTRDAPEILLDNPVSHFSRSSTVRRQSRPATGDRFRDNKKDGDGDRQLFEQVTRVDRGRLGRP